jgi:hypothetical protein
VQYVSVRVIGLDEIFVPFKGTSEKFSPVHILSFLKIE